MFSFPHAISLSEFFFLILMSVLKHLIRKKITASKTGLLVLNLMPLESWLNLEQEKDV